MGDAPDRPPPNGEVVARLHAVSFAYRPGWPVVRSLTLAVRRGRVLALLGPNGTGKTTALRLLTGALRPSTGTVTRPARAGVVPQLTQLVFAYTALDVVLTGRARHVGLFATPSARDEAVAAAALRRVGVGALADRPFDTLSGGERQLVLFARALASEAELLVLDEPTAALDLGHQRLVLRTIRQLVRELGLTAVLTTHQPEHAAAVADDVALLFRDGRVVAGPAQETMTADRLQALFGVAIRRVPGGPGRPDAFVPDWALDDERPS